MSEHRPDSISTAEPASSAASPTRGERARERLIAEALRLFAEHGYAKASTREICAASDNNVAAIHYYFGGKAALYREVFLAPVRGLVAQFSEQRLQLGAAGDGGAEPAQPQPAGPTTGPPAAFLAGIRRIYGVYLAPLRQRDPQQMLALRLYLREMAEPTGLIDEGMLGIASQHQSALHLLLGNTFGLAPEALDEELRGLGVALSSFATNLLLYGSRIATLNPGLLDSPAAIERTLERIVRYAGVLVQAELHRRALP